MPRRLRLAFEDEASFRAEYARNIANGGAFVPEVEACELREVVEVTLELAFCGQTLTCEAEVVHVVPQGSRWGVAVQFLCDAAVLRERLDAWTGEGAREQAPEAQPGPSAAPGHSRPAAGAGFSDAAPPLEIEAFPDDDAGVSWESLELEVDDLEQAASPGSASEAPARERRQAPRRSARLPARLSATHLELEGRTRDLSERGVLISADASDLPVGKAVELSLRHPDTGERVQVAGHVSRHVTGEGASTAVGIAFDGPPDDPALAAFVQAARESEARREQEGIRGRIEELGMANLLQMLAQSSSQGTLTVSRGGEEGVVAFERGRLRYARLAAARGAKALARLMAWPEGHFAFHAAVDALEDEDEPAPLEALLLDAARALDEAAAQAARQDFDPAASFALDREVLAGCGGLSKTEEAVVDLAAAGFSVRRMLDVIPEDDAEILRALHSLQDRGVLRRRS